MSNINEEGSAYLQDDPLHTHVAKWDESTGKATYSAPPRTGEMKQSYYDNQLTPLKAEEMKGNQKLYLRTIREDQYGECVQPTMEKPDCHPSLVEYEMGMVHYSNHLASLPIFALVEKDYAAKIGIGNFFEDWEEVLEVKDTLGCWRELKSSFYFPTQPETRKVLVQRRPVENIGWEEPELHITKESIEHGGKIADAILGNPGEEFRLPTKQQSDPENKKAGPQTQAQKPINELAEELWDEFSELIGQDIDSLSNFAGSCVLRERQYKRLIEKLFTYSPSPVPEGAEELANGVHDLVKQLSYSGFLSDRITDVQARGKINHFLAGFAAGKGEGDAVAFAEWMIKMNVENGCDGDWHISTGNERVNKVVTSEQLYQLFLKSKNTIK